MRAPLAVALALVLPLLFLGARRWPLLHRYFALSEGWTDEQQPPISKARPLSQWAWQPEYDSVYGAPLEAAVVTNLTGGDQLYTRRFERCTVSLAINAALGNSSNASIVVLKTDDSPTASTPRMPTGVERARRARRHAPPKL